MENIPFKKSPIRKKIPLDIFRVKLLGHVKFQSHFIVDQQDQTNQTYVNQIENGFATLYGNKIS